MSYLLMGVAVVVWILFAVGAFFVFFAGTYTP